MTLEECRKELESQVFHNSVDCVLLVSQDCYSTLIASIEELQKYREHQSREYPLEDHLIPSRKNKTYRACSKCNTVYGYDDWMMTRCEKCNGEVVAVWHAELM